MSKSNDYLKTLTDVFDLNLLPKCVDEKLSIGLGRDLSDRGISQEEAYYLAKNDIARAMLDLDQVVPWWRDMSKARRNVFVLIIYQLGVDRFLDLQSMIGGALAGHYDAAADGLISSEWAMLNAPHANDLNLMMREG